MKKEELNKYSSLFSEYTELRIQENRHTQIALVNGDIMENQICSKSGVSARTNINGLWGFSSDSVISDSSIEKVVLESKTNAEFIASREKEMKDSLPTFAESAFNDYSTKKTKWSQKEQIDFLKEIDDHIAEKYTDLSSRSVALQSLDMEKSTLVSGGAFSYSMIPKTHIFIGLTLDNNNDPVTLREVFGGFGQLEDVFTVASALYEKIELLYENLKEKADGVYAKAGIQECIIDASITGILAHEAIGHTTEADIVSSGSIAAEFLNQEVASPLITLVDFANTAFGELCAVPVFMDDEGVKAEDCVIIEKGILKGYMHSKETAQAFNVKPTGNGRAFEFLDEPLVRMRNTAILPGESKLEDMIASIDDGYYLTKSSNGQADSTSEFMFGVVFGYEIKNGKLGKAIRDITISGMAFDMLKSVTEVSNEIEWRNSGMCGKKQWIPVSFGGPAIKCKINIGGK